MTQRSEHSEINRGMFNRIARGYDLANHVLSMGRDFVWRHRLAEICAQISPRVVLDIGTGTGDMLLALSRHLAEEPLLIGVDPAEAMLAVARQKLQKKKLAAEMVQGDAQNLPFPKNSADCITVSFGVRNFADLLKGLHSLHEVLGPGGLVAILEFSMPKGHWRKLYLLYLRHFVPLIGGLIAGDRAAYRYLNSSIERFPSGGVFCAIMREAGFEKVQAEPLTFGIVTLYTGFKSR